MSELLVDFITSLDGYGAADGWPAWWGLEGPEYLEWLAQRPATTLLMGANTYRLMSGFAGSDRDTSGRAEGSTADEAASVDHLAAASKVVFSSTLDEPLAWANTTLVRGDAVEAVRTMKAAGDAPLSTVGSLSLSRSLLEAGLVDRFRVVVFPIITGATGSGRVYDDYPDVALDLLSARTFDERIQLLEYRPRVVDRPPFAGGAPSGPA